jgi:hypothetical protein
MLYNNFIWFTVSKNKPVSDPHPLNADPDPSIMKNADPDLGKTVKFWLFIKKAHLNTHD